MIATALLYSGRENPRWEVPAARAAQVAEAIEAMAGLDQPCPPPGGLGYTGVSITVQTPIRGQSAWTFGAGVAVSGRQCFADGQRRIERMVLETGRGHIDTKLLDGILESFPE